MQALTLLLFALLARIAPGADRVGDARAVVPAIAWAVTVDTRPPVFESRDLDGAVLVVFAWHESRMQMKPRVRIDARAWCALQVHGPRALEESPTACAQAALYVMHEGARICPVSPMAPYAGSCLRARALADARVTQARALLVPFGADKL